MVILPHTFIRTDRGVFKTIVQLVKALRRRVMLTKNNSVQGKGILFRRCLTMRYSVPEGKIISLIQSFKGQKAAGFQPIPISLRDFSESYSDFNKNFPDIDYYCI